MNLANYTNVYPISKSDHLIVWDVPYGCLEIIIHRQSDVLYDAEKDPVSVQFQVAHKIVPKVARQKFNGLIMPVYEEFDLTSHSWLNKSFASFFEKYMLNQARIICISKSDVSYKECIEKYCYLLCTCSDWSFQNSTLSVKLREMFSTSD